MVYFAPYIDASGLHIPTYQDIEDYLVEQAKSIFGSDIYLGNDSQDFQDIAARAKTDYEALLTSQFAYNSRSPVTATGTGLDAIVAINGIVRKGPSFSTCPATLVGTAFTVITNGVAADDNGNLWALPESVTLDDTGEAVVTVTCQESGPISANIGQINIINTPTSGWTSITNTISATVGRDSETDAELRARQKVSVSNPSQAITTGILGAVLAVDNVVNAQLYENDTASPVATIGGVTNPSNYPANSITMVVDGGDTEDIATAISIRKTPGCYTDGDVVTVVSDRYGVPKTIRFYRPTEMVLYVQFTIKPLSGYSSAIGDAAMQALYDYVNSLYAGQSIINSELWRAILTANTAGYPYFSLLGVLAHLESDSPTALDIELFFNEKATIDLADIELILDV